jgi:hypothetical protein
MILKNRYIRIVFDENGQASEICSVRSGEAVPFRPFRIAADSGVRDIWDTDPERATAIGMDGEAEFVLNREGDLQILKITNQSSSGVTATQTVTLRGGV